MRRAPLLMLPLLLAALTVAALHPWGTPRSFSDVEEHPARQISSDEPRVAPPTPTDDSPAAAPPAGPPIEVELRLAVDPRGALSPAAGLMPIYDAEAAWPLPDELPEDSLVVALDELWAASDDERAEALDALDLPLLEAHEGGGDWGRAAALAARRELQAADRAEAEAAHNAALAAWADAGGAGPLPPAPPAPRGEALVEAAVQQAALIDLFDGDPRAADLLRLEAAALRLDPELAEPDEAEAIELLRGVIDHTDDAPVLAAAVDLLAGTRAALDPRDRGALAELLPELPPATAARLASFLADQALEAGALAEAHRHAAAAASAAALAPSPDALPPAAAGARAALGGLAGAPPPPGVEAGLVALGWSCWSALQRDGDPWIDEGTDFGGRAAVGPLGLRWSEWDDENALQRCIDRGAEAIRPGPGDAGRAVELRVSLAGDPGAALGAPG